MPYCRLSVLLTALLLAFCGSLPTAIAAPSILNTLMEASRAIVSIESENAVLYGDPPKPYLVKETGQIVVQGNVRPVKYTRQGAGIIVSSLGLVVTNAHVVREAARITVTLHTGERHGAVVVATEPDQDLAFLQIQTPPPLESVRFADSSKIRLQNKAYSIGSSPLLRNTISEGKISGIGKKKKGATIALIQVNFDLYRGDSGSPIFDDQGRVLGIISASSTVKGKTTYAIPSNTILKRLQAYAAEGQEGVPEKQ